MQNKTTDNLDANSATPAIVATSRQMQVFKIYPLDSRPIAESQSWISVVQVLNELRKRILLRYGLHHRFISVTAALRLLNSVDRKDFSAILKVVAKHGAAIEPAFNTPQSKALAQAQQDTVQHIVNYIIQQNIIKHLRQQHVRQQQSPAEVKALQFKDDATTSKVQPKAIIEEHTNNAIYSTLDHHHVFHAGAESEISVEALLNSLRLRCLGSIKVVGTERFRRLAWLHAASLGMYIEGYSHTETDRQALFMRTNMTDHANIRPCYMPTKAFQKTVMKAIAGNNPLMNLSVTERDYLLQRVMQNVRVSSQHQESEVFAYGPSY